MKLLLQRVSSASVEVAGEIVARIENGTVVLLGVEAEDTDETASRAAAKTIRLRMFEDEAGKTNLDIRQVGGELLVVSQFTLCASTRNGNRPSFTAAAPPDRAKAIYKIYVACLREAGVPVQTGLFGASMNLVLVNRGPFTIPLEVA